MDPLGCFPQGRGRKGGCGGLELSFHDVLVHKCSLNVREQNLLQAVCLGPVWHPQIIALKIGG